MSKLEDILDRIDNTKIVSNKTMRELVYKDGELNEEEIRVLAEETRKILIELQELIECGVCQDVPGSCEGLCREGDEE